MIEGGFKVTVAAHSPDLVTVSRNGVSASRAVSTTSQVPEIAKMLADEVRVIEEAQAKDAALAALRQKMAEQALDGVV